MNTARRRLQGVPAAWVLGAGVALAVLVVAALAALAVYERREALDHARQRAELLARLLEDHATRSVETASLALAALADPVAKDPAGRGAALLAQATVGQPLLRAAALLDATTGEVLAASTDADTGRRVDLRRLAPLPAAGSDRLGAYVPGRGLAALAPGASASAPAGVGFVPLVRSVVAGRRPLLLLALLNPDAIANQQQQTLEDDGGAALLARDDGQVLAATAGAPVAPGARITTVPPFTPGQAAAEHGSRVGDGLRPGRQIAAFRMSRTRPLAVMVELSQGRALQGWRSTARWLLAIGCGATAVVAALTAVAVRSLRTREAARRQRDDAQAAVAEREHELSVIVKSVQELIFRTDAEGGLTFVNARWEAATGLAPAALLGRTLPTLVQPESRAAARALFAPAADGTRAAQVLIGERRFDIAVAPLRDAGGVTGFAGSAVDVSERHAAEQRLIERNAFSALLLDTMPVPVALLDREGCYLSVNRAWEDFTGRGRESVIGQPARRFLPPEEAEVHDAHDLRLLTEGGQVRYECGFTHRDGSRRELTVTKAAVPDALGRPSGVLVCLTDISELRQAERATREAGDAAEEASRAKSEFIANISHELRTPLQSIIGFSELGLMRGRQHEKLAAMFGDIHASGQRMLALVNDLLDVSKIESTVGTFHLERTDVRPLVRETVRELEPLLAARRLHVAAELGDVPLVAKVDPLRFQQVVRNVLANAVKFSPEGAAIDVRAELTAASRIEIGVRDRGPGIPPAELEQIFEAFVQSSKTKDGSGGTGLGLAICRKIVEAHGGRISAGNAPGGGSRFMIDLPARGFADTVV